MLRDIYSRFFSPPPHAHKGWKEQKVIEQHDKKINFS